MKTFCLFLLLVSAGIALSAQDQGPLPKISHQMANYFSQNPVAKIFLTTDKTSYKPGEKIWSRVFATGSQMQLSSVGRSELILKLYDSNGKSEIQQLFKLENGSASCDLSLPKALSKGTYFLCAYTSSSVNPESISITALRIDPGYDNTWMVETTLKDSISIPGQKNEFNAVLKEISGDILKNSTVRYQLMNGTEMIAKGKIKTNDQGKLTIPFVLPSTTNVEPFLMTLGEGKEDLKSEHFLPTSLDPVLIKFFPEGGTIIPGVVSKIGFTAFNKWGIPVEIEGEIKNQDGQVLTQVRTFAPGLGMFTSINSGNQKLKLVIQGKTGQNQSFELPNPNPDGLSLSIVKNDAQFVSANLVFADKLKHSVALTMTQVSNFSWAADLEINQNGRIKIPVDSLPHGLNLLSVFSLGGNVLAERVVFVDKKQELKIEIQPEKIRLATGESMKVKVRLTDEKNQPVAGNMSIAVSDQYRIDASKPEIDESLLINSELETPYSLISGALKGKISQSILMNVYLIANRMKSFNWTDVINFNPSVSTVKQSDTKDGAGKNGDLGIPAFIAGYAQKYRLMCDNGRLADAGYFTNNPGLFQKAPKVYKENTVALDNQRRMFESATSILEVIKTLKPYRIQNNMIVFVGSENSLNFQGGALIVLDGQMLGTDISQLSAINPSEVDHINVSTNAMDIQRYTGLNNVGLIEIFQKKATMKEVTPASESNEKYDQGYRLPSIFPAVPTNADRDTRTTLIWIPQQNVDSSGQYEFSVTAGSVLSDFVVEVEGISENGRMGCGKVAFKVVK